MNLDLDRSTWRRVTLGDVVNNVNITVKDPADVGIDRVIAMEHLDPGELKIQRWGNLASGTTFTRRVRPGQTLFGKRRAYQRKVAYAEFDAICSGDILTFEPDPTQMLSAFLPFLVRSDDFYDHALGTSAGSLSPRTNWRDLSSFEFALPPLDEQKRIADLLWAAEREREAAIHLSRKAHACFRIQLRAFSDPSSADAVRLNDVAQFLDSRRVPLKESERAKRRGTVPYYGASGRIDSIDEALFDEPLVLLCEDGFGLAAWDERPIAYRISGPAWVNNHAHVLRATGVSLEWLHYSLMHYNLDSVINTTVKPKLTMASAKALRVRKTPHELSLVARLNATDRVTEQAVVRAEAAIAVRRSVLAQVFGGAA